MYEEWTFAIAMFNPGKLLRLVAAYNNPSCKAGNRKFETKEEIRVCSLSFKILFHSAISVNIQQSRSIHDQGRGNDHGLQTISIPLLQGISRTS
jgi:hypothetical protein